MKRSREMKKDVGMREREEEQRKEEVKERNLSEQWRKRSADNNERQLSSSVSSLSVLFPFTKSFPHFLCVTRCANPCISPSLINILVFIPSVSLPLCVCVYRGFWSYLKSGISLCHFFSVVKSTAVLRTRTHGWGRAVSSGNAEWRSIEGADFIAPLSEPNELIYLVF